MLLSRSGRILLKVRRLALIAVGAAVAAVLLAPAVAAWLREPGTPPLPEPMGLQRAAAVEEAGGGLDKRVHNWPLADERRVQRVSQTLRRSTAAGAEAIDLAPAVAAGTRASALAAEDADEPAEDDDERFDEDEGGGDEDDGDDLGDG